jgi:hypothetical protein
MSLKVIGTGLGRTGTYSLKLALNELGLGPCYHMEEVILNMPSFLPKWQEAVAGKPDWAAIYDGYPSAVDWPTASYFRELYAAFPRAKFVHTVRSPESWVASFSETIHKLLQTKDDAPPQMRDWLEMSAKAIAKAGIGASSTPEQLARIFETHTAEVKAAIPAQQLLIFEAKQGWAPLCEFLGTTVPTTDFPRTNNRQDFWEKVKGAA